MSEHLSAWLGASWRVSVELAPWLLLGLFVAGLIHVLLPANFLKRALGRRGFRSVFLAALFGVPLPLCSCGVIPAAIGLRKEGASEGASVGFLISTPQTGVDSILVSANFLGWPFALFKVFSAFFTGLLGGIITDASGEETADLSLASTAEMEYHGRGKAAVTELFHYAYVRLLGDFYVWVILGVIVAGGLSAFVPENYFLDKPWASGFAGMLVMLLISLPLYVCATSSVPIAAALVHAGLPPGAALVFLMAGPASNVATVGAIFRAFGKRVVTIYLLTVAVSSLVLGSLFNFVIAAAPHAEHGHGHEGMSHALPDWAALAAAAVLGALLLWHLSGSIRGRIRMAQAMKPSAGGVTLTVKGMTCQNCVGHVTKALQSVPNVVSAIVDLKSGRAVVQGADLDRARLIEAVKEAGYDAA